MPTATPTGKAGQISAGIQTAKETAASDFDSFLLTSFTPTPEIERDEPEAEIGQLQLDRARAERWGHNGVTLSFAGRFRPRNLAHLCRAFGMEPEDGGFVLWDGVNETISVTDDGGGPVTVDIITGSSAVADTKYSGSELAAFIKAALDADATLSQTYTVTYASNKFTISHGGSTLSLHWTTTPMIANLLGYDHSADDTGSTSYEADEERDPIGKWWFRDGDNEVLRVTDNGGGPIDVDVLAGDGAVATERRPLNAWTACGALKAVLDADTTLDGEYTVTYAAGTNKFTIATDSVSLSLHHSHANSTMSDYLGFSTAADDTGATTYTSDTAYDRADKLLLRPYASGDDFPWYSILQKIDASGTLDLLYIDSRINSLSFDAGDKAPLRFTAEGRAMDWQEAVGTEVVTTETSGIGVPNTSDPEGHVRFGGSDYRIMEAGFDMTWDEQVESQQVQAKPYAITPGERSVSGALQIGFGAEDDGALYRATYFGATDGTAPSNTIVERTLDIEYASGQIVPGQTGTTERYSWRFEADECQLELWPPEQSGTDLVAAELEMNISRDSSDWTIGLVGTFDYGMFE